MGVRDGERLSVLCRVIMLVVTVLVESAAAAAGRAGRGGDGNLRLGVAGRLVLLETNLLALTEGREGGGSDLRRPSVAVRGGWGWGAMKS